MSKTIFLSAVSSEFHERDHRNLMRFASYRDVLANALQRLGPEYVVITQENLAQGYGDLLETLEVEVERSDLVIHLVGNVAGYVCEETSVRRLRKRYTALLQHEPEVASSLQNVSNVTYTQWEIYLAFEHRCRRLVFVADAHAPRSPMCNAQKMEESQEIHLTRLKKSGEHREPFEDQRDVALKVVTSIVRFGLEPAAVSRVDELSPKALAAARENAAGLVHAIADGIRRPDNSLSADIDPVGVDTFLRAVDTAALLHELDRRHALEIAHGYRDELRNAITVQPTADELRELAFAELAMGDYPQAIAMAERCAVLAAQLMVDDPEHAEQHYETVLNGYLLLHDAANAAHRRDEAMTALERGCQFIDKTKDPILWADYNEQLANYLLDRAQIHRAEELIDEITDIREEHQPETSDLARSLLLWCRLLSDKARHADLISVAKRAEAIYLSQIPPMMTGVAAALSDRANALRTIGQFAEAEPLMRRALAIAEQSYGAEHPNVASCLNNLALLLQDTNCLAEAEPLMRRALAIDEQSYGAEHPKVAIRLNNLAQLLQATNRLAEAEPLMRRALAIGEQSYGVEHPRVAQNLWVLAVLLRDTDRLSEALQLMDRSVAIYRQFDAQNGYQHPDWDNVLGYYRRMLQASELSEAEIADRLREFGGS